MRRKEAKGVKLKKPHKESEDINLTTAIAQERKSLLVRKIIPDVKKKPFSLGNQKAETHYLNETIVGESIQKPRRKEISKATIQL